VSDEEGLSGAEIVLLIEALDALIPFGEDTAYTVPWEERERWAPYSTLRHRLKEAVRMSFDDGARGWLDTELSRERIALTDKLNALFEALLRDPGAHRRSMRHGFVAAIRSCARSVTQRDRSVSDL
jgi:hypothetical protein